MKKMALMYSGGLDTTVAGTIAFNLHSLPVNTRGIMLARQLAMSKSAIVPVPGAAFASTSKAEESNHVHGSGGACLSSSKTAAAY